ncbi:putative MFS family arabinose efflux permease [Saccharopolyspora erythraea NRRL 2338]|uniref:Transporter, MFS superfamily n=2 Tax=Saccharopolyspora erythraea TaxID=1836 RepID=A4FJA9_SACEN|nr:MFS transporter [Saccharopolyspora erythraea]EQD85357.1 MFS transporter [Saccharopolyspora erythraea D]PFG97802.1 putative MFS family arabinose efflux permease [Saccharopolyspora erythraea NRRL 2338]QRK87942.1 MFS transporter [Saccharopolyspora erythraea]CAM04134.1 transporter, MFS superfamily [Saccharopolyspora erythraea NRRL 2338]
MTQVLPAPAPAPPRREIWLAAWPVTAVMVLSNAATPLYVLWQHRIGFSAGVVTVVYAAYIVGLLGALMVAGIASDRLGRKPILLPALLLGALACLLFATATTVPTLVLARLLTGIAVGAILSAGTAAVSDVAGPRRSRLASLLGSTAMVLGAGLGPLLAGVLSETLPGPTVAVFVLVAAVLATAFLVMVRMPLPRRTASAGGSWVRLPAVPRANRRQLALGLAAFAPGISAVGFVLSLGPSLLSHLLGTDNRIVSGATIFVLFTAATAVQFAVRGLAVRRILLLSAGATIGSMVSLLVAVHGASVPALVLAALLAGAGQGLGQLGGLSLLGASVPPTRLAEANAALNAGGYLPAGVLPVLAGYLSDGIGLPSAATAFGVAVALAALLGGAFVAKRQDFEH